MPPKYEMNKVALVFFISFVVLMLTDLGFVVFGGVGNSLSSWIVSGTTAKYFPPMSVFIFCLGAVFGHLAYGMTTKE